MVHATFAVRNAVASSQGLASKVARQAVPLEAACVPSAVCVPLFLCLFSLFVLHVSADATREVRLVWVVCVSLDRRSGSLICSAAYSADDLTG